MITRSRIRKGLRKLEKARSRRLIATMERIWVEENKKLNLINYIYYRYFTKDFLVFLLETKYKDENKR